MKTILYQRLENQYKQSRYTFDIEQVRRIDKMEHNGWWRIFMVKENNDKD